MNTYILMLSKTFPKGHLHAGEQTFFKEKLGISKLHTIRANYPLWEQRIAEIQASKGVLSIRQWVGEPYKSKQVEITQLTANEGVGIQKLIFIDNNIMLPVIEYGSGNEFKSMDRYMFAKNDGLSFKDWKAWFRNYDLSNPLAIIHFTNFRY